jgi:hypothetical protein
MLQPASREETVSQTQTFEWFSKSQCQEPVMFLDTDTNCASRVHPAETKHESKFVQRCSVMAMGRCTAWKVPRNCALGIGLAITTVLPLALLGLCRNTWSETA